MCITLKHYHHVVVYQAGTFIHYIFQADPPLLMECNLPNEASKKHWIRLYTHEFMHTHVRVTRQS